MLGSPLAALLALSFLTTSPVGEPTELLDENGPVRVGESAPTFAGWDVNGQLVTLAQLFSPRDRETRVVVLTFFATWCGPCAEGLPSYQQLAQEVTNQGVRVIAVSVGEDVKTVTPFLAKLGIDLLTVTDPFGTISKKFGLGGEGALGCLPRTFVLDREHKVHCIIGAEGDDLLDVLRREVAAACAEE